MAIKVIDDKYLVDIADAIRSKTGTEDTYKPTEMADAINSITTGGSGGGDLAEKALNLTGDCSYRFAYGGWDWLIKEYGNQMATKDITDMGYMFQQSKVEEIPFAINMKPTSTGTHKMYNMFDSANFLKTAPIINDARPYSLERLFRQCFNLKDFPENYGENWDWSNIVNASAYGGANKNAMLQDCYSLRKVPMGLLKYNSNQTLASYSIYANGFNYCVSLDEISDLPVLQTTWNSNAFSSTFTNCFRLKKLTFETNVGGEPKTANWKGQTIDLTTIGFGPSTNILRYNSGITVDKQVEDYESYERLMEDEDWFTTSQEFSRYDYGSAWETICSLPDTSAYLATNGGTNTIKFKGSAGEYTPAGAINTMPEEEIAVATAKGWTVSFV